MDTVRVTPGMFPPTISTTPNSPMVWAKLSATPVTSPEIESGRITRKKVFVREAPSVAEAAMSLLGPGGHLVLSGTSMERPHWQPLRILLLELVVTGAYEYDEGGFEAALQLLASGALPIDELAEPDDTPLDGLLAAMEGLAAGEITRKVMVNPT